MSSRKRGRGEIEVSKEKEPRKEAKTTTGHLAVRIPTPKPEPEPEKTLPDVWELPSPHSPEPPAASPIAVAAVGLPRTYSSTDVLPVIAGEEERESPGMFIAGKGQPEEKVAESGLPRTISNQESRERDLMAVSPWEVSRQEALKHVNGELSDKGKILSARLEEAVSSGEVSGSLLTGDMRVDGLYALAIDQSLVKVFEGNSRTVLEDTLKDPELYKELLKDRIASHKQRVAESGLDFFSRRLQVRGRVSPVPSEAVVSAAQIQKPVVDADADQDSDNDDGVNFFTEAGVLKS